MKTLTTITFLALAGFLNASASTAPGRTTQILDRSEEVV